MSIRRFDDVVFQHMIDLPQCDCVFCSAREESTGRTRLYLVFQDRTRIYVRNGVKDMWDELEDEQEYRHIRSRFDNAVLERKIPCFSAGISAYRDMKDMPETVR